MLVVANFPCASPSFVDEVYQHLTNIYRRGQKLILTADSNIPNIDWYNLRPLDGDTGDANFLLQIVLDYNLTQPF